MGLYRYWAFDLRSKTCLGQLPLTACQLTMLVNTPGTFQANLYPSVYLQERERESYSSALADPTGKAATNQLQELMSAIEPGKTLVVIESDRTVVGSAIIWQWVYNSELNGNAAYYQLGGAELLSYLQQRNYRGNTGAASDATNSGLNAGLATGIDQVTGTLKTLVDYCMEGNGNIGIDTTVMPASGVTNQQSYDPTKRDPIYTLISNLSQTIGGPDVWVSTAWRSDGGRVPELTLVAGYPKLGKRYTDNPRLVPRFNFPGSILSYTMTRNGLQSFSVNDEISKDSTGSVNIATSKNSGLETYGRYPETDFANNRAGTAAAISNATLQSWAEADADLYNGPLQIANVIVRPESTIGILSPGDDVRLTLNDYAHPGGLDSYIRVLGIQYDFDSQTVTLQADLADGTIVSSAP